MTERQRQEERAWRTCEYVYRWHYLCDDNVTFSAIAPSEAGAFRVLNAERPGMHARFDGCTSVPAPPIDGRLVGGVPVRPAAWAALRAP